MAVSKRIQLRLFDWNYVFFPVHAQKIAPLHLFYMLGQLVISGAVESCREGATPDSAIKDILNPHIKGIRGKILLSLIAQKQYEP